MFTPQKTRLIRPGFRTPSSTNRNRSLINSRTSTGQDYLNYSFGSSQTNASFNQSMQNSIMVTENQNYTLSSYGHSLPVLVTEALTLSDRNTEFSAKLSENGWAWLVCGRRLFIWKYKHNDGSRPISYCKELMLPPSDLAHKANLVCIFDNGEAFPSAMAISPEGIVRYWARILQEAISTEISDLHGQECFSLTNLQDNSCILATTTSSLVHIQPIFHDGQPNIISRTLKIPQGMLAGFGRRVSSFIFGAVPNQGSDTKQLARVLVETSSEGHNLYVLTGTSIQKWFLSEDEIDQFINEADLDRRIKQEFLSALSCQDSIHHQQIKTWAIDVQLSSKGLLLLCSCLHPQNSEQMNYALITLNKNSPEAIIQFNLLNYQETFKTFNEELLLSYNLLLPSLKSQSAYFYNSHKVVCVALNTAQFDVDILEFINYDDKILGSGICENLPLFFSSVNGIVSVSGSTADLHLPFNSSIMEQSVEEKEVSNDPSTRFKVAFLLYCKRDFVKLQDTIENEFPPLFGAEKKLDSNLDRGVYSLSLELINDIPSSDPRWANPKEAAKTSSSLLLLWQLNDKLKVHDLLLNFLKTQDLWKRLYQVTIRSRAMDTKLILCENAEKLKAAIALKSLTGELSNYVDQGIKRVLKSRDITNKTKLTSQDIFYQEVSNIDDIYVALLDIETELHESSDIVNVLAAVNQIFLDSLQTVIKFRQNSFHLYESDTQAEYLPWTSSTEEGGLRNVLIKQFFLTFEPLNVRDVVDERLRSNLKQQLFELADIILDGYRCQLESVKSDEMKYNEINLKYIEQRQELITPFLEIDQYDRAASLAEKYCDFQTLVVICEKTDNQERLERYMKQFEGFSDYLFKWYLDEGKRGKLLSQPSVHHQELEKFLNNHQGLNWLHHFNMGHFERAQPLLNELAEKEMRFMAKKKTILSISKLAALASEEPHSFIETKIAEVDAQLELLIYQETLPATVLEAYGLDVDTMRVLTARELIEMYVSPENKDCNEYCIKKALDLINFCQMEHEELLKLRTRIWCLAVLRDDWSLFNTDTPADVVQDSLFFRVVDLAFTQGMVLQEILIPVDELLKAKDLEEWAQDPNFVFLLKAGYEHVNRIMNLE